MSSRAGSCLTCLASGRLGGNLRAAHLCPRCGSVALSLDIAGPHLGPSECAAENHEGGDDRGDNDGDVCWHVCAPQFGARRLARGAAAGLDPDQGCRSGTGALRFRGGTAAVWKRGEFWTEDALLGQGASQTAGRRSEKMAPRAGFEPATNRLTAGCSTTELPGNTPRRITKDAAIAKHCCGKLEATPGIEPGYADLQSAASPLRHVAFGHPLYRSGVGAATGPRRRNPSMLQRRLAFSACLPHKAKPSRHDLGFSA